MECLMREHAWANDTGEIFTSEFGKIFVSLVGKEAVVLELVRVDAVSISTVYHTIEVAVFHGASG
eukprot:4445913-Pyramimonas_sp.AAC.1